MILHINSFLPKGITIHEPVLLDKPNIKQPILRNLVQLSFFGIEEERLGYFEIMEREELLDGSLFVESSKSLMGRVVDVAVACADCQL